MGYGKGHLGVLHRKQRTCVPLVGRTFIEHWFVLFQQQRTYVVSNHQVARAIESVRLSLLGSPKQEVKGPSEGGTACVKAVLLRGHWKAARKTGCRRPPTYGLYTTVARRTYDHFKSFLMKGR